ncbi:N-6 DNA methylase [Hyalangium rubrum]|uniref:site-specific DNA-methyltransferase (adenine-specific) n=1 Tax=Hyalangium rubrum TaxID=3103134 RepID=A0ABU5H6Z6_9BACT|nr:N-6 DNA methylase [Hyalangium sp. s54d21]MDY7229036.1 N-6 DNA methylase [Hyalangium sp. s54d21]
MATMMKAKAKQGSAPVTTAERLGSLLKSARDIMRKDKGLNGDLDRLPMLTWILFLKFLDDMEALREAEARREGKRLKPAIEAPYRWRDWAAKEDGITGEELIAFINQERCRRPDGSRGAGLFSYLRSLRGAKDGDRRDVIATVFKGTVNRMINGYLLRDVLNKVNGIHFTASEEIHTLGNFYESMLKEMGDGAGDSGEFYTPRSVVRFMVRMVEPKLGERVLDPACGTGGFLVEAFQHLSAQCRTSRQRTQLQADSILGGEAKPLPYMLAQMNLLLHGLESPRIVLGNSLATPLREIGPKDRVDVILTNPPFGGEEERGILENFPEDKQTAETALLFLQLIMWRLRRGDQPGRAAIVVSDGFLSTKGVAARIKSQLLSECNLHTVVRLPRGVFTPYTPIASNLLFFDRSGPTKEVWFYEVPGPTDRHMYSKTRPFRFEEFTPCIEWWRARAEGPHSWRVPVEELVARDFDLDVPNPRVRKEVEAHSPTELFRRAAEVSKQVAARSERALELLRDMSPQGSERPLSDCLKLRKEFIEIEDAVEYTLLTVQLHGRGLAFRGKKRGAEIKTRRQQVVRKDDLIVAEIDAKLGGFGLVPAELEGAIVSSHYFVYEIDRAVALPEYLDWYMRSGIPEADIRPFVKGSTNYAAIRAHHFPLLRLPLPSVEVQRRLVAEVARAAAELAELVKLQDEALKLLGGVLPASLRGLFTAPRA